jgi:hypothetical protein
MKNIDKISPIGFILGTVPGNMGQMVTLHEGTPLCS